MSLLSPEKRSSIKSGQLEQLWEVKLDGLPLGQRCGRQIKGSNQKFTGSSIILRGGRSNEWPLAAVRWKRGAQRRVQDAALLGTSVLETTDLLPEPQEFPTGPRQLIPFCFLPSQHCLTGTKKTNTQTGKHKARRVGADGDSWRVGPIYRTDTGLRA